MGSILEIGIKISGLAIAVLSFSLLLIAGKKKIGKAAAAKMYDYINNHLQERKSSFFSYDKIESFLKQNGAQYFFGFKMNPVSYLGMCMICAAVLAAIGFKIHPMLAFVLAVAGGYLPGFFLQHYNRQENKRLLPDLKLTYSALSVQIRAGVYLTEALMECYLAVENKRLKDALYSVSTEIAASMDVKKALDGLNKAFDSIYIDSLCVILLQSLESGQSTELLADISEQMKAMEEVLLNEGKEKLDAKMLVFQLLMLGGIMVVILFASFNEILISASNI